MNEGRQQVTSEQGVERFVLAMRPEMEGRLMRRLRPSHRVNCVSTADLRLRIGFAAAVLVLSVGAPSTFVTPSSVSAILIPLGQSQAAELTSAEDGVLFDLDANGVPERVSWTKANTNVALLVLDRNTNGIIDNGSELFGDHTMPGEGNGYEALRATVAQMTNNRFQASVDADDPLYPQLLLWTDLNHNGRSEPSELRPASEVLTKIGLGYEAFDRKDGHGNRFRNRGWAELRTAPGRNEAKDAQEHQGRLIKTYDVFLVVAGRYPGN